MSRVAPPICLDPIPVTTDPQAMETFAAALRPAGEAATALIDVPHTFPMAWLTLPPVLNAVRSYFSEDALLVQSFQSFHYRQRLAVGETYLMHVDVSRPRIDGDVLIKVNVRREGYIVLDMQVSLLNVRAFDTGESL